MAKEQLVFYTIDAAITEASKPCQRDVLNQGPVTVGFLCGSMDMYAGLVRRHELAVPESGCGYELEYLLQTGSVTHFMNPETVSFGLAAQTAQAMGETMFALTIYLPKRMPASIRQIVQRFGIPMREPDFCVV